MKIIQTKLIVALFIFAFSQTAFSSIDSGAPRAAHAFEEAAAALHEYLHDEYGDSYGSHGLEGAGSAVHDVLHDYQHGDASEGDVVAKADDLKLVWNEFRQTINPAQILHKGDETLDQLNEEAKDAYQTLRFLLRKAKDK